MHKLLELFGCHEAPTHDWDAAENLFDPMILLEKDGPEENEPNRLKHIETSSYSKIGSGPGKSECQDSYTMLPHLSPNLHFFAVYDGHGVKGKNVSTFVSNSIAKCFKKNVDQIEKLAGKHRIHAFFSKVFKAVENKLQFSGINITNSGTCCLNVLVYKDRCIVSNLGDCRAVLCREEDGENVAVDLSQDHKPTREDEKIRIQKMGGQIEPIYYRGVAVGPLRVWTRSKEAGIAMTRAMGDTRGKLVGLISEPEIQTFQLKPNDKFIIVASDGLWEVMTSEEAVNFVLKYQEDHKNKSNSAKILAKEAKKRWFKLEEEEKDPYCDDITILIVYLHFNTDHLDGIHEASTRQGTQEVLCYCILIV